jgi:hypothetical protein
MKLSEGMTGTLLVDLCRGLGWLVGRKLVVWGHADGVVASVEGDELGLEEDVSVDLEVGGGSLDTAEASY